MTSPAQTPQELASPPGGGVRRPGATASRITQRGELSLDAIAPSSLTAVPTELNGLRGGKETQPGSPDRNGDLDRRVNTHIHMIRKCESVRNSEHEAPSSQIGASVQDEREYERDICHTLTHIRTVARECRTNLMDCNLLQSNRTYPCSGSAQGHNSS